MTTSHDRGSAKIYQFPPRGRFVGSAQREESNASANLASPRVARIAFGSGWYHDEAIQEAELTGNN